MKRVISIFSTFLLFSLHAYANCPNPNEPYNVTGTDAGTVRFSWSLNKASLWLGLGNLPFNDMLYQYQDYIIQNTDIDPYFLLQRQRNIYAEGLGESDSNVKKFDAMIRGDAGIVVEANCIEKKLLSEQFKRVNYRLPTEFLAYIFQKGDNLHILGAWRTQSALSGPVSNISDAKISELLRNNWQFVSHLHNHPFSFDNPAGDIAGTVIGSDPDFDSFRKFMIRYNLKHGRVTNGFNTGVFERRSVEYLLSL